MTEQCNCPKCGSKAYKRNGYTRHGKQNHRCLDCGRQFSSNIDLEKDIREMADHFFVKEEFVSTNYRS